MNNVFWNKTFLLFTLFLLSLTACDNAKSVKTIKLAHGLNPQHSVHKAMVFMGEKLKEKSGGKMELEIYHSGQLGSESQCLELLQIGSLGITKVSSGVMESFDPRFKVLGLPYIFRSKEHMFNVQDSELGKNILLGGEDFWLRGLVYYDAGSRSFYTKEKPVKAPADLSGQKIRVMKSITANKMVNAMGGAPMPISWGELYTALQQGVVDGAENNPPSFYLSRHYEVCKYYSLNEHTSVPDILIVSTHIWNSLSDQEKQWLQEAANESVTVQRELWKESEKESLEAVEAAGVEVIYPEKQPFADKVDNLYDDYKSDKEIWDLIQKIRSM